MAGLSTQVGVPLLRGLPRRCVPERRRGRHLFWEAIQRAQPPWVYRGVSSSPVHRTFVSGCEGPSIAVLRSVLVV